MSELHMLLQTLDGSIRITDNSSLFSYSRESRSELYNVLVNRMSVLKLGINEDEDDGQV